MPVALSHAILDDWLKATIAAGGPTDAIVGEDADAATLDRASAALGRQFPSELVTLWSWRQFAEPARELGEEARILSPAEAARWTNTVRGWYDDFLENDDVPEDGWSHDLVIWNNSQPYWHAVDTSRDEGYSPVLTTMDANMNEPPSLTADSLGDLFSHWTLLLKAGQQYYEDGTWLYREGELPMSPSTREQPS